MTPTLVILREYGSKRKASGCSILQFLEQQARYRYQIEPPPNAFEYLLLNGRLFLVFDGLDELLETSYRQEISSDVEAFCRMYRSVPVLITSREVGYEQAPLNEKNFDLFRLGSFDAEQVEDYAKKWFVRDNEYSKDDNLQKAAAFVNDSAFVPDLRSNPLMLGLMCNLYRAEGYIPRNRPEVYGKCSVMLFERWDKSRDIVVPLPFEEHIRPAMQDLAYWIYSDEKLQGGVSESCLVSRTSAYLCMWVFDDPQKAARAASDFISFCTGRAWVFTDTGTTAEGERLFQFTHRTFLEYFTACYVVSVYPTPDALWEALQNCIRKGEWDVVAQLSFQIQSKQVQGAADQLLNKLIQLELPASERWTTLSFAERSLEFLVPSPKVRRELTQAALGFWLKHVRKSSELAYDARGQGRHVSEHVGNILACNAENRSTVADELATFLKLHILGEDPEASELCSELALDLTMALHATGAYKQVNKDIMQFWFHVSQKLADETRDKILGLAVSNWPIAVKCYWRNLMTLDQCIDHFGVEFLVTSVQSPTLSVWFVEPGYFLVDSALGVKPWYRGNTAERQKNAVELAGLSGRLLRTPLPWLAGHPTGAEREARIGGHWWASRRSVEHQGSPDPLPLSPDAVFVMLCLLALDIDSISPSDGRTDLEGMIEAYEGMDPNVRQVLIGRINVTRSQGALKALDALGFDEEQRRLMESWVTRKIDFVERTTPSRSPS